MDELSRVFKLKLIADAWLSLGLTTANMRLNEKIVDNKSVIDLLSADEPDHESVIFAGSRLKMSVLSKKRRKFKLPMALK